jgi:hypothetical protein
LEFKLLQSPPRLLGVQVGYFLADCLLWTTFLLMLALIWRDVLTYSDTHISKEYKNEDCLLKNTSGSTFDRVPTAASML